MKKISLLLSGTLLAAFALIFTAFDAVAASPEGDHVELSHPWAGKTVAFLGDSITDPETLRDDTHYWGYLQEWLDITPLVYGKGGHMWFHILGQAEQLRKERGDDFDAIMIFVGTNDYNAGLQIGEWFTEEKVEVNVNGKMVERTRRVPVMDQWTYRSSLNKVLDSLKRMFPTKQIVMLTPIHRGAAKFGEWNVQPTEDHQNACGEYLDAYVNSIKEASSLWSVPVIDLYSLSGLYPMHAEQGMYVPGGDDCLHPDADGHRRLAKCLYYQLLTLPCVF